MLNKKNLNKFVVLCLVSTIISCTAENISSTEKPNENEVEVTESTKLTKEAVVSNYADIVLASYQDSLMKVKEMKTAIDDFTNNPSQEKLEMAKQSWLEARIPYGQTESYRFYGGPIDNDDGPEGQLNAWPLDEVYIDYVEGNSDSGIINDKVNYPEITTDLLKSLNEKGGDKNISTGYHAVEFLLWGQDLTLEAGAGNRPYTDYLTGENATASNADRRIKYLETVTDILISDLESLVSNWEPGKTDNFRAEFTTASADDSLGKILKGIGTLSASELASERIATPLDVGEREEEHSCFSDNTADDIKQNAQGITNVIFGSYKRSDGSEIKGASIYELLSLQNKVLADKLKTENEAVMTNINSLESVFDQEIRPDNKAGNERVTNIINSLKTQGDTIVELGKDFGINVNTELE